MSRSRFNGLRLLRRSRSGVDGDWLRRVQIQRNRADGAGSPTSLSTRVLHAINGLARGGTETVLADLLTQFADDGSEALRPTVITLGLGNELVPRVRAAGAVVIELSRASPASSVVRAWRAVGEADVVCSWSYRTHMLMSVICQLRSRRCVWFVRHSAVDFPNNGWKTWVLIRLIVPLSYLAGAISYNGMESKINHERIGFARSASSVAINACDTALYRPRPGQDAALREELGLARDDDAPIILSASRWHPIKDVPGFIASAGQVRRTGRCFRVVLCGRGLVPENDELVRLIGKAGMKIGSDIFLLGLRTDLHMIMAGADIYVLHSKSEAFPNTVLQAMASGLKVICTDVGGVREITAGAVPIVEPGDVDALAGSISNILTQRNQQRSTAGKSLREIVRDRYSMAQVLPQYSRLMTGTEPA